jgi:ABC-type glycerol-3-phosphate transport system permease component
MDFWDRGILTNLERRTSLGRTIYILFFVILAVFAFTFVFPFIFAFTSGLKNSTEIYKGGLQLFPTNPQWTNYTDA